MKSKFDYTIISDFLSPIIKDRIIYELSSEKKRIKGWSRFSHNVDLIINQECFCFKCSSIDEAIKNEIKKEECKEYVILSFEFQEGKAMSFDSALNYLNDKSFAVLLLAGDFLIIKPEYEGGQTPFSVLKKK